MEPGKTAARFLNYGRIILGDWRDSAARRRLRRMETGLICLKGSATIAVDATNISPCVPYDALYVPRDAAFEIVRAPDGCDLAEIAAPVEQRYPVQFVTFADVQKDPGLHFAAGSDASRSAS